MTEVINFLRDLEKNNHRDWFKDNKSRYDQARMVFLEQVQKIINALQFHDLRISGLEAKDAMFRIYRDIRFSKDNTPYKTHFATYMARGGRKSSEAGYYLHIGNDELFLAGGVHSPGKEDLHAIRQEIMYQPETIRKIIDRKVKEGFQLYEKDKLKKGPMGFPKDSPQADLLKYKHFLLSANLDTDLIHSPEFPEKTAEKFRLMIPFTAFLNTAMEFKGNE